MQPVPCWGKVWVTPENLPPGSTLKVFKWVKTEKIQVRKEHSHQGHSSPLFFC